MFFSYLISSIKSRLSVKSILIVIVFISAVSILFTVFFMTYHKRLLTGELYKRAHSLTRNLAYNSRYFFISQNKPAMQSLVSVVQEEPDVENVFLIGLDGSVLSSTDTSTLKKNITVSAEHDSTDQMNWHPIDDYTTMRLIRPVVNNVIALESDTLFYSPNEKIFFEPDKLPPIQSYQPNFSHTGEELICTASFRHESEDYWGHYIASVLIENSTLRFLVKGSNGYLSHNGRYLAFNDRFNRQLVVLDTITRDKKIIASYGAGQFGVPCFTPDDQYVIVTLLTENGNERLFRIPRDGGEREQLTFHDGKHWIPDCSPDGKWLLYSDYENFLLYVYNNETKKTMRLFPDLKDQHWSGSFSPDGTKICYLRFPNDPLLSDIYVADFPYNDKPEKKADPYGTQLTFTSGWKLLTNWSPNGKWITYCHRQGYELPKDEVWIVQPSGGEPINVLESLKTRRAIIGHAVLDISKQNLNRAIARGNRIAVIIAFTFTGIAILGAFLLIGNIVRPVKNIAHSAEKIAEGDFDQMIELNRNDEIGILVHSFNKMTTQLKTLIEEKDIRNRELEKANKELETLDKAKDDFLSLVSHEIRTPLTSILASSEMLMKGLIKSDETKAKFHTTIVKESRRLTRLVKDVLDISKIEAGRMTFNREALNIRELVDEIHKNLDPILTANEVHFDCEQIPSDANLLGDKDKVLQVLENIISNAVKYTTNGAAISVSLKMSNGIGTIAVKDTGKGIAEEDIPRVFDRFTQLENVDHHSEGAGLGMAISKSIIEGLGGKIWIESKLEVGTIVYFTLPLVKSSIKTKRQSTIVKNVENQKNNQEMANTNQIKILIVDDEEPLRLTLSECIKSMDLLPIESSSGKEALSLIEQHNPALVILDVMMPGMSGLEVCRKLRNDPKTSTIKIIILSAKGQLKEQEEGLKAGADRYITKPYDYMEMVEKITELLGINN